ncbi:hypothetical protein RM553_02205 [Zunongwangia sp. F363]|uniref:Uncharacterized protein n=1 Tax=Autumnicola tepida TaxID=3075595 RepID=A0ABU3C5L8_9FLAO|nr:hypothetical protein [Zunongwangia sp. F363]MDT0641634.1 hypothetical protein [Zunongwangia sp. F363]
MVKKLLVLLLLPLSFSSFGSNEPILITESAIQISFDETKEILFSFAEGDEILIDLEMVKGKHLKEFQISGPSSNTLFSEYKLKSLTGKKVKAREKGVYSFKFYRPSLTNRAFKITISRIPANEQTMHFNTDWRWETQRDTVYIPYTIDSITGYNTIQYTENVKELIEIKREEDLLVDKNQRVHSYFNENESSTFLLINLPQPLITDLREERIISWAYWIGVGQESQEAYKKNTEFFTGLAEEVTSIYGTPLAGLAMGAISELIIPKTGEDVSYWFIPDEANLGLFRSGQAFSIFDKGKGIAAYGKNTTHTSGTFFLGLHNDNQVQGIDVDIKIVA